MSERIKLAPGFRFYPSDQELITCYLKPKILGQKLVCNIIGNKELYGPNSTPWELLDVNDEDSWTGSHDKLSEKYLYVFTTLSKIRYSDTSKQRRIRENTCKKAGCGTWDAKTKRKPIRDCQGNVIGEQRMLLFEINDIGDQFDLSKAGHFRMHEYSLGGINKGLKSAAAADVVLCKITFDSSKSPVFNLGSKTSDYGLTNRGEGQPKQQNKEENLERSVEHNLEGTGNLSSTSVVDMKSGVADNTESTECLTSENMFVKDSGLGDSSDYLTVDDLFDNGSQEFNDFGWDSSFTDSFMALLNSNPEEWAVEDISNLGKRKFEEENLYTSKKICL